MDSSTDYLTILVAEPADRRRQNEPVTVGVPLPRGWTSDLEGLHLFDEDREIATQFQASSHWSDGSLQWVLLDFLSSVEGGETREYKLHRGESIERESSIQQVEATTDDLFRLSEGLAGAGVVYSASDSDRREILTARLRLTDSKGREHRAVYNASTQEVSGPIRNTYRIEGVFDQLDTDPSMRVTARLNVYPTRGLARLDLTIHNPGRAQHPGGRWDLGDSGSLLFADLSLELDVDATFSAVSYVCETDSSWRISAGESVLIYQDSSGGDQWNSSNHVNRNGDLPVRFKGYKVLDSEFSLQGDRATPVVRLQGKKGQLAVALREFWQNFPKAIEATPKGIRIGLFPDQHADLHELQGGEQKTHTVFIELSDRKSDDSLRWIDEPLLARSTPELYRQTGILPVDDLDMPAETRLYESIVQAAVEGDNTFEMRNERVDEFGWRHFGDVYADHEELNYRGSEPLRSHYNNQYDLIRGFFHRYLVTGDHRWYRLMDQLARHVMDIDTYHTQQDKSAYNGGPFWHTAHYLHAGRATHRTYSAFALPGGEMDSSFGGGPANENNYYTGLLFYHFASGDPRAKETVLEVANWVLAMEDGTLTVFRFLDSGPTGLSSGTRELDYHGPGRGAGNSISTLMDAFLVSRDRKYLEAAEALIERVIHPLDDLGERRLDQPEERWSYVVFLQVLGRFLELKLELNECDRMFRYARASLIHYVQWMVDNESLALDNPDILEFPTETWAAQDLRKSDVLQLAARFGPRSLRETFLDKARGFYRDSLNQLFDYDSCTCVRPIAVLLACGPTHIAALDSLVESTRDEDDPRDFGVPATFTPQREHAITKAKRLLMGAGALLALAALLAVFFL